MTELKSADQNPSAMAVAVLSAIFLGAALAIAGNDFTSAVRNKAAHRSSTPFFLALTTGLTLAFVSAATRMQQPVRKLLSEDEDEARRLRMFMVINSESPAVQEKIAALPDASDLDFGVNY